MTIEQAVEGTTNPRTCAAFLRELRDLRKKASAWDVLCIDADSGEHAAVCDLLERAAIGAGLPVPPCDRW